MAPVLKGWCIASVVALQVSHLLAAELDGDEGCASLTKVTDCIAPTTAAPTTVAATTSAKAALVQKAHEKRTDYCEPAANVECPGSGNMCAGNQCCPGVEASGNLTFPCPSATKVVQGCGSLTKVTDCIAPTTAAPTTVAATTSAKAALVQKAHEK